MIQLHTVGAQLRMIGRCALVGSLAGMLATQAVAQGATAAGPQTPAKPETTTVASDSLTLEINPATTANLPLVAQDAAASDQSALPDAPAAATSESASLDMPVDLKALMDDPGQAAQNVQPTPAPTQQKHQIHPGWLALAVVGMGAAALGGLALTKRDPAVGPAVGILVVPGVAMMGAGLYFAFR